MDHVWGIVERDTILMMEYASFVALIVWVAKAMILIVLNAIIRVTYQWVIREAYAWRFALKANMASRAQIYVWNVGHHAKLVQSFSCAWVVLMSGCSLMEDAWVNAQRGIICKIALAPTAHSNALNVRAPPPVRNARQIFILTSNNVRRDHNVHNTTIPSLQRERAPRASLLADSVNHSFIVWVAWRAMFREMAGAIALARLVHIWMKVFVKTAQLIV